MYSKSLLFHSFEEECWNAKACNIPSSKSLFNSLTWKHFMNATAHSICLANWLFKSICRIQCKWLEKKSHFPLITVQYPAHSWVFSIYMIPDSFFFFLLLLLPSISFISNKSSSKQQQHEQHLWPSIYGSRSTSNYFSIYISDQFYYFFFNREYKHQTKRNGIEFSLLKKKFLLDFSINSLINQTGKRKRFWIIPEEFRFLFLILISKIFEKKIFYRMASLVVFRFQTVIEYWEHFTLYIHIPA